MFIEFARIKLTVVCHLTDSMTSCSSWLSFHEVSLECVKAICVDFHLNESELNLRFPISASFFAQSTDFYFNSSETFSQRKQK